MNKNMMMQCITLETPDGRRVDFVGKVFLTRDEMLKADKNDIKVTLHEPVEWGSFKWKKEKIEDDDYPWKEKKY